MTTNDPRSPSDAEARPNPACEAWCTLHHFPDDFARAEGQLFCRRTFGEGPLELAVGSQARPRWGVYLEGGQATVDPADPGSPLIPIEPRLVFSSGMEDLPLGDVRAFASAVNAAAEFCGPLKGGRP